MKLKDEFIKLFQSKPNSKELENKRTNLGNKHIKKKLSIEVVDDERENADIKKWRKALNYAEDKYNPDRYYLLKLYNEVILDSVVSNGVNLRKDKILSSDFNITINNEINEDLKSILNNEWFYDFLNYAIDSIFFGYSIIQINSIEDNNISSLELLPREHIIPEFAKFKKSINDDVESAISYTDKKTYKWLIELFKDRKDLGELYKIIPHYISKKVAMMSWTQFVEKFGQPIAIGRTTSNIAKERESLEDFLKNLGSDASGVLDPGTDIELKESSKTDVYKVYMELIKTANEEINTSLLGSTEMTSGQSGGSEARAKVHQSESLFKTRSDLRYITEVINNRLIPKLKELDVFPKEGDIKFVFRNKEFIPPKDKILIDEVLLDKYRLSKDYIEKTYQVEIDEDDNTERRD